MASKIPISSSSNGSYGGFCMFPDDSTLLDPSNIVAAGVSRENSIGSSVSDTFVNSLSLEDSPLSSPSDVECFQPTEDLHTSSNGVTLPASSSSVVANSKISCTNPASKKSVIKNWSGSLPVGVRLPQRKGGMHLWQFLYSILQMPEKYAYLIEWTSNQKEFEFRLIEPDAIAVWWGYHKNKKNMSYDKLSRSLRYYYDKQIIRKIGGERYVYRFCVDPEVMYKAIGNSENRPKLKPMPKSAESMLLKNQQARNSHQQPASVTRISSPCSISKPTFIAEEADLLNHCTIKTEASLPTSSTACSLQYPPPPSAVCNYDMTAAAAGNNTNSLALDQYSASPIDHATTRSVPSLTINGWHQPPSAQDKHSVAATYQNDMFTDLNSYLYQMYPNNGADSSTSACSLPPPNTIVPPSAISESYMPTPVTQPATANCNSSISSAGQFIATSYADHQSIVTTSSIPEMAGTSLNMYTADSRPPHTKAAPYYPTASHQNFVSEATDLDFSSTLPNTIDSVVTCSEYSSMPLVYHHDLSNNGSTAGPGNASMMAAGSLYAVYDNHVATAAPWPLMGTNAPGDFSSSW